MIEHIAPVVEYVEPAPAVKNTGPAPVIEDVTPPPDVTHATPVPVIDDVTVLVVIEYIAPAPSATSARPSLHTPWQPSPLVSTFTPQVW